MSLGYAEKLSFIEDVGQVGMAEFFDPSHVLQCKVSPPPGFNTMIDRYSNPRFLVSEQFVPFCPSL